MPLHVLDTWGSWIDVPPSIQQAFEKHQRERIEQEKEKRKNAIEGMVKEENKTDPRKSLKRVKRESGAGPAAASAAASSSAAVSPSGALDHSDLHSIYAAIHGLAHCMIALMPMSVLTHAH
jgi:hypothetical protein